MARTLAAVAFDGGSSRQTAGRCSKGQLIRRRRFILKTDQYWAAIQSSNDSCLCASPFESTSRWPKVSRSPPRSKGSIMPHTDISLDPGLTGIERPPCPKCDRQMMFAGIISGPPGFDIRTFECIACSFVERVLSGTDVMGWMNSSGLRPPR
jgi:hypothetical protein